MDSNPMSPSSPPRERTIRERLGVVMNRGAGGSWVRFGAAVHSILVAGLVVLFQGHVLAGSAVTVVGVACVFSYWRAFKKGFDRARFVAVEPAMVYEALIEYTGYGKTALPKRDLDRVFARFGIDLYPDLVGPVLALEDDFYRSTARYTSPDLVTMGHRAIADFRAIRPEVPFDVAEALAWCYTFDYK